MYLKTTATTFYSCDTYFCIIIIIIIIIIIVIIKLIFIQDTNFTITDNRRVKEYIRNLRQNLRTTCHT